MTDNSKIPTRRVDGLDTTISSLQSSIDGKQNSLTSTQLDAVNSGITASKVSTYDGYASEISGKQNVLSNSQLNAVNSGITATLVSQISTNQSDIAGLATVATSGSYNDLDNKPTIPSEVTESTVSDWGFTKNTGTVTSVNNVSPVNGNVTLSIPTVNDATLTITQGGTTKGTFTANASSNVTIDLDSGGGSADVDNKSITTNSSDELQTVGVINSRDSSTAVKTWTGTKAQYDSLKATHIMYRWGEKGRFIYTEALVPNINDPVYNSSYKIIGSVTQIETHDDGYLLFTNENIVPYFRLIDDTSTKTIYINQVDPNTLYNITDDTDVSLTILEALYPVGSVYITTANTCPLSALISGSTWTQETCRQLVEKKEPTDNDPSWYNLYSDGWCEQGGHQGAGGNGTQITLLKPFANTNYNLIGCQSKITSSIGAEGYVQLYNKTTSGFRLWWGTSQGDSWDWQACGYTSTTTSHKQFRRTA